MNYIPATPYSVGQVTMRWDFGKKAFSMAKKRVDSSKRGDEAEFSRLFWEARKAHSRSIKAA